MENMEERLNELHRKVKGMIEPHTYSTEEIWTNIAVKDILKLMEKIFPELKERN